MRHEKRCKHEQCWHVLICLTSTLYRRPTRCCTKLHSNSFQLGKGAPGPALTGGGTEGAAGEWKSELRNRDAVEPLELEAEAEAGGVGFGTTIT